MHHYNIFNIVKCLIVAKKFVQSIIGIEFVLFLLFLDGWTDFYLP